MTKNEISDKIIKNPTESDILILLFITAAVVLTVTVASIIIANVIFSLCFTRAKDPEGNVERGIQHIERNGGNGAAIREGREWMLSQNVEHHYITSRDGLRLHGFLIPNPNTDKKRMAVLVHGYQGSPAFDFSAAARYYYNNGFALFLPDQRTHGESEGKYITFGAFERYDVVDWCKYLDEYTSHQYEFILSGVSMGATTVLLAAAEPDMIKLNYITADCGFTDPARIFTHVFRQWYHLPTFPILNFARLVCKNKAKFSFDEFSTTQAVKNLCAPVTFIHGEADDFVTPDNSIDNYNECTSEKQLVTVPDAAHGVSYIKDPIGVQRELQRIFDNYFS